MEVVCGWDEAVWFGRSAKPWVEMKCEGSSKSYGGNSRRTQSVGMLHCGYVQRTSRAVADCIYTIRNVGQCKTKGWFLLDDDALCSRFELLASILHTTLGVGFGMCGTNIGSGGRFGSSRRRFSHRCVKGDVAKGSTFKGWRMCRWNVLSRRADCARMDPMDTRESQTTHICAYTFVL